MPKIDLKQISLLAQIPLSDKEIKTLEPQLQSILEFVEKVKKIPVGQYDSNKAGSLLSDLRSDEANSERTLTAEEALANSSDHDGSAFVVKGVFE